MFAISLFRDSDSADSSDKGYFRSFRTMHSSHMLREGARPEIVPDKMGHAKYRVTQNVYGKSAGCLAKFRCEDYGIRLPDGL